MSHRVLGLRVQFVWWSSQLGFRVGGEELNVPWQRSSATPTTASGCSVSTRERTAFKFVPSPPRRTIRLTSSLENLTPGYLSPTSEWRSMPSATVWDGRHRIRHQPELEALEFIMSDTQGADGRLGRFQLEVGSGWHCWRMGDPPCSQDPSQ